MVSGDDPGRLISCWRGGEEHVPEGTSRTSRTMFLFSRCAVVQRIPLKTARSSMENRACGPPYPSKYLTFHETNGNLSIPNYTANGSLEFSRERERERRVFFTLSLRHDPRLGSTPAARINLSPSILFSPIFNRIIDSYNYFKRVFRLTGLNDSFLKEESSVITVSVEVK